MKTNIDTQIDGLEKVTGPLLPVVEVTPFNSGKHSLHGTPWGNEVTEVTPEHTKNHWDTDTDSNAYFDSIRTEYHEILLWTHHQNIYRMPKKDAKNFPQIVLGRSMHVSKVSWGCGQSAAVKGKPNEPRNYSFPKVMQTCQCDRACKYLHKHNKQISIDELIP